MGIFAFSMLGKVLECIYKIFERQPRQEVVLQSYNSYCPIRDTMFYVLMSWFSLKTITATYFYDRTVYKCVV